MLKKMMALVCAAVMVVGMAIPTFATGSQTTINGENVKVVGGTFAEVTNNKTAEAVVTALELAGGDIADAVSVLVETGVIIASSDTMDLLNKITIVTGDAFTNEIVLPEGTKSATIEVPEGVDYVLQLVVTKDGIELVIYEVENGKATVGAGPIAFAAKK